jgi:hypothetical protein
MEVQRQKELKRAEREKRREIRAAKVKLRTVSDWTKLAQAEFNRFIRLRDRLLPCVSCGGLPEQVALTGGAWDCGHYRSVGAAPELRFDEQNAHKQCKSCNGGKFRGYVVSPDRQETVRRMYRATLMGRIGPAALERLEGPHEPKRYRIEDLIAIRDEYRRKTKALREATA